MWRKDVFPEGTLGGLGLLFDWRGGNGPCRVPADLNDAGSGLLAPPPLHRKFRRDSARTVSKKFRRFTPLPLHTIASSHHHHSRPSPLDVLMVWCACYHSNVCVPCSGQKPEQAPRERDVKRHVVRQRKRGVKRKRRSET